MIYSAKKMASKSIPLSEKDEDNGWMEDREKPRKINMQLNHESTKDCGDWGGH